MHYSTTTNGINIPEKRIKMLGILVIILILVAPWVAGF